MNLYEIPEGLPIPEDDGAASHLIGQRLPAVTLTSTSGTSVNLSELAEWSVIYCYPMTGRPDLPLPHGWDEIPGARGCTPQSCAFRDHHAELRKLGASLYGLSTQATDYQKEMVKRLHLPFDILSDAQLQFCRALTLPTITVEGTPLLKRLTLISFSSIIRQVHYPVFPPQEDAARVISWLEKHPNRYQT